MLESAHPNLGSKLALVVLRYLVFLAVDQAINSPRQTLHLLDSSRFVSPCQRLVSFDPLNLCFSSFLLSHESLQGMEPLVCGVQCC